MNYPPTEQIRSRIEQERLYNAARKEIESLRASVKAENVITKGYKHDRDELREEVKIAKRHVVTLTKSQKAAEEANKAGMWSGGAAITVTILYEIWNSR